MNTKRQWTHHIRSVVAVLAVAFGLITASAAVASADQACSSSARADICLSVRSVGGDLYNIHIGFDYRIGQLAAERLLAQPGDPVDAWMIGDDLFGDDDLFEVPIQAISSTDFGLSVDFDITVPSPALDEDPGDGDEVYARIRVFDNTTVVETFRSPTISSPFTT